MKLERILHLFNFHIFHVAAAASCLHRLLTLARDVEARCKRKIEEVAASWEKGGRREGGGGGGGGLEEGGQEERVRRREGEGGEREMWYITEGEGPLGHANSRAV